MSLITTTTEPIPASSSKSWSGPGFTGSPGDVSLLLYNGANGTAYGTRIPSPRSPTGTVTPSGHVVYSKLISGIQNGAPDGFALVVNGM